ncbi:esterase/lipase family protein [Novosphingobium sp. Gsoil 351]|uniref:esterase/lipase family protein n=1 Tax=Novosphingobium sp. Gsoil 351 TaxID=2675225 RepID=UPI00351B74E2
MTPASAAGLPVMLLPGFATHPARMYRMRRGLRAAGHWVEDWGLGWNLGGTPEQLDRLCARIEEAAARQGRPVALVGWSLGGLYAREAAKRVPHAVAMVVTMGTPFSGDLHANNAWRAYHWITGHDVAEPPVPGDYAVKPPVPTIALWSARDGIVAPRGARAGRRTRCRGRGALHPPRVRQPPPCGGDGRRSAKPLRRRLSWSPRQGRPLFSHLQHAMT